MTVIPEITIKISFSETPGAGGPTAVVAASSGGEIPPPKLDNGAAALEMAGGGEIAPPMLDGDATALAALAGIEIAPPVLDGDAGTRFDVPPPTAVAVEGANFPPPPGVKDEPDDSLGKDAPPPLPGKEAKRGR